MDLILAIIIVIVVSCVRQLNTRKDKVVSVSVSTCDNSDDIKIVSTSDLVVGNNLRLLREPRAFHMILDEWGLE